MGPDNGRSAASTASCSLQSPWRRRTDTSSGTNAACSGYTRNSVEARAGKPFWGNHSTRSPTLNRAENSLGKACVTSPHRARCAVFCSTRNACRRATANISASLVSFTRRCGRARGWREQDRKLGGARTGPTSSVDAEAVEHPSDDTKSDSVGRPTPKRLLAILRRQIVLGEGGHHCCRRPSPPPPPPLEHASPFCEKLCAFFVVCFFVCCARRFCAGQIICVSRHESRLSNAQHTEAQKSTTKHNKQSTPNKAHHVQKKPLPGAILSALSVLRTICMGLRCTVPVQCFLSAQTKQMDAGVGASHQRSKKVAKRRERKSTNAADVNCMGLCTGKSATSLPKPFQFCDIRRGEAFNEIPRAACSGNRLSTQGTQGVAGKRKQTPPVLGTSPAARSSRRRIWRRRRDRRCRNSRVPARETAGEGRVRAVFPNRAP